MTLVADIVLERPKEWGMQRVHTCPGDGINGLRGAFDRAEGDLEGAQARHGEMEAFMVCAHSKFTGDAGCCVATSGPGQVLVEVSEFCQMMVHPGQAPHAIDRAFKTALTTRGVATIISPNDVQEEDAQASPPKKRGATFSSVGWSRPRLRHDAGEPRSAAQVPSESGKVATSIGQGAAHAQSELVTAAELLEQAVVSEPLPRLPDRATLTADSCSGTPYAVAARFAYPDRPVIAFVGGEAFQMNGMNGMITVKRHPDRQSGSAPFVFCVFNNRDVNQVTWEQRAMPYARYAELLGLKGIYCDKPKNVGNAWDEALASDVPVVLEFKVDAEIAPVPPHIVLEQGKKAAKAAVHDPEKARSTAKGARQKATEPAQHLPGWHP